MLDRPNALARYAAAKTRLRALWNTPMLRGEADLAATQLAISGMANHLLAAIDAATTDEDTVEQLAWAFAIEAALDVLEQNLATSWGDSDLDDLPQRA